MSPEKSRVLFVGLGNMGRPMAANLIAAGYRLCVFDLVPERCDPLTDLGADRADDLTAASNADVVLCSLPGPPQVRAVVLGANGILAHLRPGATLIDTTTNSFDLAREIAAEAETRGIHYLEAPVTNAADGAARGELGIFAAGERDCFDEQKPLLDVLGKDIHFVGPHGNGAVTKLVTNYLWFIHAAAVGEGLMIGAKAGIPLDTLRQAINTSAGASWVSEHDIPSIFAGHYDPSFSLALCCKDLGLAHEIADSHNLTLPMGTLARQLFEQARDAYGPDAAELHVARLIEEREGLLLRPPHGEAIPKKVDESS